MEEKRCLAEVSRERESECVCVWLATKLSEIKGAALITKW